MVVLVGIMISTIGVALAVSFDTTSDLASLSSDEHLLPAIVGKTTKNGSALVSIILTMGLAALLILSGSYLFLVKLIVLSSFVQYLATIGSLIKLRNDKSLPKGMQIPFGLAIPIISIIIIVYLMFSFNWISLALAAGAAIIGGVIYCLNAKNPAKAK
jgi:amino acid transporter